MLDLLKVLGIKADIPSDERTYREAYEPFIRQMEEHFGMVSDGIFTLDEYVELKDVYYPGCEISAGYLLGKLADMGYIAKLPEDHSRYENRYRNMVVKAETDLSLLADGIITGSEYQVLLEYPVEAPARAENLKLTVKNDTVTLSWSKVPGAVYYEVSWVSDDDQGSGQRILSRFRNRSEVSRTNWTWKGMETGVTMSFYVVPCKYSVKGEESSVSKYIDIYYQPVSASQFISRKDSLYGKYVKVTGLRLNNWSVRDTSGEFRKTSEAKSEAQCSDGYDVYLLGKTGNDYVELVIKDYASWGWENTSVDLLGQINRITSITAQGTVGISSLTWGDMEFLPSIELSYIWWRYR